VELVKVINNDIDKAQYHVNTLIAKNDILLNKLPKVIQLCKALKYPQLLSIYNTITYENNVSRHQMLSAILNSKTIFEVIVNLFDEKRLTNKLISLASDRADIMLEKLTGVATRIKE
ncbi:16442_t:CDS:2, partial [Funneliformis geosporum]